MEHQQNGQSEAKQSGNAPTTFGHNRPTLSFAPASVAEKEEAVQIDAAAQEVAQPSALYGPAQSDAGARDGVQDVAPLDESSASLPHLEQQEFTLSVEEILIRLREVGIEKSKDSVQRYCREGLLDCQKFGLFKRYFATEKSLVALIEKMQPDENARNCIQVDTPASTRDIVETSQTDAPASNSAHLHQVEDAPKIDQISQSKSSNNENLVDFLKDEIRVKNNQLEVKDTQIAAMLERDHETNILIRGLQNQLGETFAMLSGRSNKEESTDEKVRGR